jgi:soluble lytic murein transglycosylase-like protein
VVLVAYRVWRPVCRGVVLRMKRDLVNLLPMLEIECLGVSVHKQLLFMACFVCLVATVASGQSVRISDADVNLIDLAGVNEALKVSEGRVQAVGRSASRGKRVIKFNSEQWEFGNSQLREAIYIEAARYKIDPDLVFALVWQESRWDLRAVSPRNATGPLQLMPGTAARFGVRDPHDPKEAVRGGVAYLVWLLDRFGGNVSLALAGYNAGEGAVDAYLSGKRVVLPGGKVINAGGRRTNGIPPYDETENYVRRIAERYRLIRAERQAASTILR